MGDASCSGSTPFKQLIDHQRRDGGVTQDRMAGLGPAGAQGSFRSAPHPAQAQSQREFAAFMDGGAGSGLNQLHPHDPAARLAAHAAALDPVHAPRHSPGVPLHAFQQAWQAPAPAPAMSNWAADFQRSNDSQHTSRGPVDTGYAAAPTHQHNLQQGFGGAAFGQNMGYAPLYGPTNGGFTNFAMAQAQRPAAEAEFQEEMNRWMSLHGPKGSMDEVDAVMDQMARELELNEPPQSEGAEQALSQGAVQQSVEEVTQDTHTMMDTSLDAAQVDEAVTTHLDTAQADQLSASHLDAAQADQASTSRLTDLETPEARNLALDASELRDALTRQASAQDEATAPTTTGRSAVAEAAEQLLDTVQHESGDKWQNSKFLRLMREFRDGKKDIVDDRIQAAEGASQRASPVRSESGRIVTDFRKTHSYASTPTRSPREGQSPRGESPFRPTAGASTVAGS